MSDNRHRKRVTVAVIVILVIYLASGIYTLQSGQRALILQFGKVTREVAESGIHYHLPYPFETAYRVHVSKVQKISIQEQRGSRLEEFTGDENLILVDAVVSYDVKDLRNYLFNQQDVRMMVASAGQMCLSQELASMTVDDVMTTGKSLLRLVMKDKLQETLDVLQAGVRVISVELTNISPPSSVSMTFKAVSDAREKKQGIIKEAEGYANSTIPNARGQASSIISQAGAYGEETRKAAIARSEAFEALLKEFRRNPEITAKLRYLDTVKALFNRCQVKVDANPEECLYYIGKGKK